ncbi:MAG: outer membrane beta-barrel protein [Chitinivibrionales bacterium]|nr:outer membrane beta-barrel protein [Chitinivibrionales bacterium]
MLEQNTLYIQGGLQYAWKKSCVATRGIRAIFALLPFFLWMVSDSSADLVTETEKLSIYGIVRNVQDDETIPAALVFVEQKSFFRNITMRAFSDINGQFALSGLAADEYRLSVFAGGFEPYSMNIEFDYKPVSLDIALAPVKHDMSAWYDTTGLPPIIIGTIADKSSNAPVEGAVISVQSLPGSYQSSTQGQFGFILAHAGRYRVFVAHAEFVDTADIELFAGRDSVTRLDVMLRRKPELRTVNIIAGQVVDAKTGEGIAAARCIEHNMNDTARCDSLGYFFMPVAANNFSLFVVHPEYDKEAFVGDFEEDQDTAYLLFELSTKSDTAIHSLSGRIYGTTVDDSGRALDSVMIVACGVTCADTVYSDANGNYAFDTISMGVYDLRATKAAYHPATGDDIFAMPEEPQYLSLVLEAYTAASDEVAETKAAISGYVIDASSGNPLGGANIMLENTRYSAVADMHGKFSITNVRPGEYVLIAQNSGYNRYRDEIEIGKGPVLEQDIKLTSTSTQQLNKLIVQGKLKRNTQAALLKRRQDSFSISTTIGSDQMSKAGAGNAADAAKYLTGVTVIEDKFIIIRGMSDRYVNTTLNGLELPSPNPDQNSVTFDLFPAGLLANLSVTKTYAADLPGNFTGGIVNIETKAIPEKPTLKLFIGNGINAISNFRNNFLTYEGGCTDWLGFDDGTRNIPEPLRGDDVWTPTYYSWLVAPEDSVPIIISRVDEVAKAYNVPFQPHEAMAGPDQSYGLTLGNTFILADRPLGLSAALNYSNKSRHSANGHEATWELLGHDSDYTQLDSDVGYFDTQSKKTVLWGGLVNGSFQIAPHNMISANYLYTRNAEDEARHRKSEYHFQLDSSSILEHFELKYIERGQHYIALNGTHGFEIPFGDMLTFAWQGGYINTIQNEPDYRIYSDLISQQDSIVSYSIPRSIAKTPSHQYRLTKHGNYIGKLSAKYSFYQWNDLKSNVSAGVYRQRKTRDFMQRRFKIETHESVSKSLTELNGDANTFLGSENMGLIDSDTSQEGNVSFQVGNIILWSAESDTPATHTGILDITADYVLVRLPLSYQWSTILGVRYEDVQMSIKSRKDDSLHSGKFEKSFVLPSVNVEYAPVSSMKFRVAYSNTYALPVFREIAPYESEDVALKIKIIGNPELRTSFIYNVDLGWEWFLNPGEILALSGFFKYIESPIVKTGIEGTENGEQTWDMSSFSRAYGIELEWMKKFDFIHENLKYFGTGGNITMLKTESQVDSLKESRLQKWRTDPNLMIPLPGASPFVANLSLQFDNPDWGLAWAVFYNHFGSRLVTKTFDHTPDIYEFSRPELNATITQTLFDKLSFKFSAKNLVNPEFKVGYEFNDKIYKNKSKKKGRSYSFKISYSF